MHRFKTAFYYLLNHIRTVCGETERAPAGHIKKKGYDHSDK